MRQGGLDQIEIGPDVEPKCVVPLLVADLGKVAVGHLERRIAYQDIDAAEFGGGSIDHCTAVSQSDAP